MIADPRRDAVHVSNADLDLAARFLRFEVQEGADAMRLARVAKWLDTMIIQRTKRAVTDGVRRKKASPE